ncbi:MAG: hypothetical protein ACFCD0_29385 [Gemmataceae bacterium]
MSLFSLPHRWIVRPKKLIPFALRFSLVLFLTCCLVNAALGQFVNPRLKNDLQAGSRRPNYVKIPVNGNAEKLLWDKLNKARLGYKFAKDVESILENWKDSDNLPNFVKNEQLKKLSKAIVEKEYGKKNPFVAERAKNMLNRLKEQYKSSEPSQQIEQQFDDKNTNGELLQILLKQNQNSGAAQLPTDQASPKIPPSVEMNPISTPPTTEPPTPNADAQSQQEQNLLQKFQKTKLGNYLSQSSEFQEVISDVARWYQNSDKNGWKVPGNDWISWTKNVSLPKWEAPEVLIPDLNLQNIPLPNVSVPNVDLPQVRHPDLPMPRSGSVYQTLGYGILLIGSTLLLFVGGYWLLNQDSWHFGKPIPQTRFDPGPWPVDPNDLKTRGNLIKAVDYLALLLLGPAATNWNHKIIAAELVQQICQPKNKEDVLTLTNLYEQARYSPPTEVLSPAELQQAQTCIAELLRA